MTTSPGGSLPAPPSPASGPGLVEFTALFSLLTALTALSIDIMLPALTQMAESLDMADTRDTQLVISALILGMVFGELLFGPLSDALGRRMAKGRGTGRTALPLLAAGLYIVRVTPRGDDLTCRGVTTLTIAP